MEETKTFIDWLKDPKPVDKTTYRCPCCAEKMEKPAKCENCDKRARKLASSEEIDAKKKNDNDTINFLLAAL